MSRQWHTEDIHVVWMDGQEMKFPKVGGLTYPVLVQDGVLKIQRKDGDLEPVKELIAAPLVNIRYWTRQP